jgi:hypothetical protein
MSSSIIVLRALATELTGASDGLVWFRRMNPATTLERARLVEFLLDVTVVGEARLLRVSLGALGDRHHGAIGPDMDGLGPVQAADAASFNGDHVLVLWKLSEGLLLGGRYDQTVQR